MHSINYNQPIDRQPDRPDELERIQAAGGRVIYWDGARVLGVLAMSRAIGEFSSSNFALVRSFALPLGSRSESNL